MSARAGSSGTPMKRNATQVSAHAEHPGEEVQGEGAEGPSVKRHDALEGRPQPM